MLDNKQIAAGLNRQLRKNGTNKRDTHNTLKAGFDSLTEDNDNETDHAAQDTADSQDN